MTFPRRWKKNGLPEFSYTPRSFSLLAVAMQHGAVALTASPTRRIYVHSLQILDGPGLTLEPGLNVTDNITIEVLPGGELDDVLQPGATLTSGTTTLSPSTVAIDVHSLEAAVANPNQPQQVTSFQPPSPLIIQPTKSFTIICREVNKTCDIAFDWFEVIV